MTDAEVGILIGGATLILLLFGVAALAIARMSNDSAFWKRQAANQPPRQQDGPPIPIIDGARTIPVDGTEVFFDEDDRATNPKPVYEVRISGLLVTRYRKRPDIEYSRTDALFRANNKTGRFEENAYHLLVNGKHLYKCDHQLIEDDRYRHYYVFRIGSLGRRIGLALEPLQFRDRNLETVGSLMASVAVLPAGTLSPKERAKQERELDYAREEAKEKREEAKGKAERLARAVKELSIRSVVYRNWGDPEYCRKVALAYCQETISNQAEIRREATDFLRQTDLVGYLQRHHPEAVQTILGRLEALLTAERVALDRAIAAAEAPKPLPQEAPALPPTPAKKRLTTEEVRAIKVRRQRVQDQDKVDLKIDKIETRLQIRERLQKLPLDNDERDMLEQELFREIEEGEDNGNAKTI